MDTLITRSKNAQEQLHNKNNDNLTMASYENIGARAAMQIEAACTCVGIQVKWPGLYPLFEVEGMQYSHFSDALSATFGQPSYSILVENEANGWEPKPIHAKS